MSDAELIGRITVNPKIMVGKPVIRGTRLTVDYVLNRLGHGAEWDDLVREYPGLTREDIRACLLFASRTMESTVFMPPQMQPIS